MATDFDIIASKAMVDRMVYPPAITKIFEDYDALQDLRLMRLVCYFNNYKIDIEAIPCDDTYSSKMGSLYLLIDEVDKHFSVFQNDPCDEVTYGN